MKPGWSAVSAGLIGLAACSPAGEPLRAALADSSAGIQFAIDLWPGEGIPVIEMRRAILPLRAEPDPSAPFVDTLRGQVGRRVPFDSTRYQTLEAGTIRFVVPSKVTGRDLGLVRHPPLDLYYNATLAEVTVPMMAHATVEFLQYRAEGTCFVRIAQRVIDAQPCPGYGMDSVHVVREPVTRWWIRTRGIRGAPGWLIVSDSTARSTRREF